MPNLLGYILSDLIEGKPLEINCVGGDKVTVTPLDEEGIGKALAYEYRILRHGRHLPEVLPKQSFSTVVTLIRQEYKLHGFESYHNGTGAYFAADMPDNWHLGRVKRLLPIEQDLGIEFDDEAIPTDPFAPRIKPLATMDDTVLGVGAKDYFGFDTPNDSGDDAGGDDGTV